MPAINSVSASIGQQEVVSHPVQDHEVRRQAHEAHLTRISTSLPRLVIEQRVDFNVSLLARNFFIQEVMQSMTFFRNAPRRALSVIDFKSLITSLDRDFKIHEASLSDDEIARVTRCRKLFLELEETFSLVSTPGEEIIAAKTNTVRKAIFASRVIVITPKSSSSHF